MEVNNISEIFDNPCNLMVNGCDFSFFPFKPHQCQEDIMKTLVETFDQEKNCIIESPTGTGKCIASLSACVAYLNKLKRLPAYREEQEHRRRICDVSRIFDFILNNLYEIKKNVEEDFKPNLEFFNTPNEEFINNLSLKYCIENRQILEKTLIEFFEDVCKLEIINRKVHQNSATGNFEYKTSLLKIKIEEINNQIKEEYKRFKYTHNIIYAIRTSSQMDVVQEELSRIPLEFKCAYLKSRDFHCLNQDIRKNYVGSVLKEKCKSKVNSCKFKKNLYDKSKRNLSYSKNLNNYKDKSTCAYYGEIEKCREASLIVCTYNYLILSNCYSLYKDYMSNPIIIIDEGHNIINSCEGCLNFSFDIRELYDGIKSLLDLIDFEDKLLNADKISSETFSRIDHIATDIKEKLFDFMINLILINQDRNFTNFAYNDFYILKILNFLFSSSNQNIYSGNNFEEKRASDNKDDFIKRYDFKNTIFNFENLEEILNQINQIVLIFTKDLEIEVPILEKFGRFIKFAFKLIDNCKNSSQKIFLEDYFLVSNGIGLNHKNYQDFLNYKGYFQYNSNKFDSKWDEFSINILKYFEDKTFKLICMNPAVQFKKILKFKPRSICLVSGTIQPFEFYETELGTKFHNKLSTSHIINKSNVNFMLFKSPLKDYDINEKFKELKYAYEFMKNPKFKDYVFDETFDIIRNILDTGSIGNLIFMKSFSIIEEFKKFLIEIYKKLKYNVSTKYYEQEIDIKNEDNNIVFKFYFDSDKKIFKKIKNQIVQDYKNGCQDDIQSCFFSVMKGTLSEGVNFENKESTSLIILGIPYNNYKDESIYLKERYLNNKYSLGLHSMKGKDWYELQAMVALNQALGRAIRRKTDFATICIVDSHISRKGIHEKLSRWIKELDEKKVTKENHLLMFENTRKFYRHFSEN